jgi:hypothetical protein
MVRLLLTLKLVSFTISLAYAQFNENVVIINKLDNGTTLMIDYHGKVIKTFSIGAEPNLEDEYRSNSMPFFYKNFALFDFSSGFLPVKQNNKWRLYNIKGKIVKDFGSKFVYISCPIDGVYRAYERIASKNEDLIVFINQNFELLFSGQKFWKATNFKGGFAFVQLKNNDNPWAIADSKTSQINHLNTSLNSKILNIKKDPSGFGKIDYNIKNLKSDSVYIDNNGKLFLFKNIVKELSNQQKIIQQNIQTCHDNYSPFVSRGLGIITPEFIPKQYWDEKLLKNRIDFNHNFIPDWMELQPTEFFFCDVANENFFGGLVIDTLTKVKQYKYYNYLDKKSIFTLDRNIAHIYGDRFMVTTPTPGLNTHLVEILDKNANVIYSLSPNKRSFYGIESTLGFDCKQISRLALSKDEDLSLLKNFTQLKYIKFDLFSFKKFPVNVLKYDNLEEIVFSNCNNLIALPHWLINAKKLKKLIIFDCSEVLNIDEIIRKCPNVKVIVE